MDILSVALFAAVAGICLSQEPVLLSPQRAEVLEGGSVLFTCLIEDIGYPFLLRWTWSNSNGLHFRIDHYRDKCYRVTGLENNSFYTVYCNVSSTSILIRNISVSRHSERWECESDFGRGRSNSAMIYVIVPVTYVQLDSTENTISRNENTGGHIHLLLYYLSYLVVWCTDLLPQEIGHSGEYLATQIRIYS